MLRYRSTPSVPRARTDRKRRRAGSSRSCSIGERIIYDEGAQDCLGSS
jgi:hypothetical protein